VLTEVFAEAWGRSNVAVPRKPSPAKSSIRRSAKMSSNVCLILVFTPCQVCLFYRNFTLIVWENIVKKLYEIIIIILIVERPISGKARNFGVFEWKMGMPYDEKA
jgi:hypothetical protein